MITIKVISPSIEIMTPEQYLLDATVFLAQCGRVCYKSDEAARTEAEEEKFIRGIVKSGHESVIEHVSATVKFICDRSCSHQLVRHRIAAYSQESQRYCDYGKGDDKQLQVICPPSIGVPEGVYDRETAIKMLTRVPYAPQYGWWHTIYRAYDQYLELRQTGSIKAEDARSVLPNATKTEVVTTFNLRQWRHVFEDRALNPRAQWQIRGLMQDVLMQFNIVMPAIFGDQYKKLELVNQGEVLNGRG